MFAIAKILGGLTGLAVFVIRELAGRWGYKVALVAAVVAVYVSAWVAVGAAITVTFSLIPSSPFTDVMAQFLPTRSVVVSGAALYFGTMATLKSWDYFRLVAGVAAKVGS